MSGFRTYQPALPDSVIHALWERKQATGIPMTQLLREAVETYLQSIGGTQWPRPTSSDSTAESSKGSSAGAAACCYPAAMLIGGAGRSLTSAGPAKANGRQPPARESRRLTATEGGRDVVQTPGPQSTPTRQERRSA